MSGFNLGLSKPIMNMGMSEVQQQEILPLGGPSSGAPSGGLMIPHTPSMRWQVEGPQQQQRFAGLGRYSTAELMTRWETICSSIPTHLRQDVVQTTLDFHCILPAVATNPCTYFVLASFFLTPALRVELIHQMRHMQQAHDGMMQRLLMTVQELERMEVSGATSIPQPIYDFHSLDAAVACQSL